MPKEYNYPKPAEKTAWDKVLEEHADRPTFYFFSSTSCNFCATAYPYIEALEKKYAPHGLQVVQIDVERNNEVRIAAGINSWPWYVFAKDGVLVAETAGWEDRYANELEDTLFITKEFGTTAGLSIDGSSQKLSQAPGCGDSVAQSAEIAAGIQEAIEELEKKLIDRIDLAASRVIRAIGASPEDK